MGRRLETGTKVAKLGSTDKQEDYLGRLVKYIPSEIVALYLAASGFVPEANGTSMPAAKRTTILWIIFGLCFILTPTYLCIVTREPEKNKGPLWLQVGLATIAFLVWAFAIGGPFTSLSWYQGFIASLVLLFVTFIIGMFKPPPGA